MAHDMRKNTSKFTHYNNSRKKEEAISSSAYRPNMFPIQNSKSSNKDAENNKGETSESSVVGKKSQCDLCKLSYSTGEELTEHLVSIMHHTKLEDKEEGKSHFCTLCLVTCITMSDYRTHVITEKHQQKLSCLRGGDDSNQPKRSDAERKTSNSSTYQGGKPVFLNKSNQFNKTTTYNNQNGFNNKNTNFRFGKHKSMPSRTQNRGFWNGPYRPNDVYRWSVGCFKTNNGGFFDRRLYNERADLHESLPANTIYEPWGSGYYGNFYEDHMPTEFAMSSWNEGNHQEEWRGNYGYQNDASARPNGTSFVKSFPEAWDEQLLLQQEQFLADMDIPNQHSSYQAPHNTNINQQKHYLAPERKRDRDSDFQEPQTKHFKFDNENQLSRDLHKKDKVTANALEVQNMSTAVLSTAKDVSRQTTTDSSNVGKKTSTAISKATDKFASSSTTASTSRQNSDSNTLDAIKKLIDERVLDNDKESRTKTKELALPKSKRIRSISDDTITLPISGSISAAEKSLPKPGQKFKLDKDNLKKIINAPHSRDERLQLAKIFKSHNDEHRKKNKSAPVRTNLQLEGVRDSLISHEVSLGTDQGCDVQTIKLEDLSESVRNQLLYLIGENASNLFCSPPMQSTNTNTPTTKKKLVTNISSSEEDVVILSDKNDIGKAGKHKKKKAKTITDVNSSCEEIENITETKKKKKVSSKLSSVETSKSKKKDSEMLQINCDSNKLKKTHSKKAEKCRSEKSISKKEKKKNLGSTMTIDLCSESVKISSTKSSETEKSKTSVSKKKDKHKTLSDGNTKDSSSEGERFLSSENSGTDTSHKCSSKKKKKDKHVSCSDNETDDSCSVNAQLLNFETDKTKKGVSKKKEKQILSSENMTEDSCSVHVQLPNSDNDKSKKGSSKKKEKSSSYSDVTIDSYSVSVELTSPESSRVERSKKSITKTSDKNIICSDNNLNINTCSVSVKLTRKKEKSKKICEKTTKETSVNNLKSAASSKSKHIIPGDVEQLLESPSTKKNCKHKSSASSKELSSESKSNKKKSASVSSLQLSDQHTNKTVDNIQDISQIPSNLQSMSTPKSADKKSKSVEKVKSKQQSTKLSSSPSGKSSLPETQKKSSYPESSFSPSTAPQKSSEKVSESLPLPEPTMASSAHSLQRLTLPPSTWLRDRAPLPDQGASGKDQTIYSSSMQPLLLNKPKNEYDAPVVLDDEVSNDSDNDNLSATKANSGRVSSNGTENEQVSSSNVSGEVPKRVKAEGITVVSDDEDSDTSDDEHLSVANTNNEQMLGNSVKDGQVASSNRAGRKGLSSNSRADTEQMPSGNQADNEPMSSDDQASETHLSSDRRADGKQLRSSSLASDEPASGVISELLELSEREENVKQEKIGLDLRLSRLHKLLEQAVVQINKCSERRQQLHKEEQELSHQRFSLLKAIMSSPEGAILTSSLKSRTKGAMVPSLTSWLTSEECMSFGTSLTSTKISEIPNVAEATGEQQPQGTSLSRADWLAKFSSFLPSEPNKGSQVTQSATSTDLIEIQSTTRSDLREVTHLSSIPASSLSFILSLSQAKKERAAVVSNDGDSRINPPDSPVVDKFKEILAPAKKSLPANKVSAPVMYLRTFKSTDSQKSTGT